MLHVLEKMLKPKKYKNWTKTSIGIWVCFKKSLDQTNQSTKMKTKLWEYQRFRRKSPWAFYEINPLCFFSCPPDQIAPSLKQVELTHLLSPSGWSWKNTQGPRDVEHSAWSFWDVFSLDFQCPLLSVSLLFWCWFAAILRNHEKNITSSKSNWHVEIGSWTKSNIPNKHHKLYRSYCWWKKSQTTTWDG